MVPNMRGCEDFHEDPDVGFQGSLAMSIDQKIRREK